MQRGKNRPIDDSRKGGKLMLKKLALNTTVVIYVVNEKIEDLPHKLLLHFLVILPLLVLHQICPEIMAVNVK